MFEDKAKQENRWQRNSSPASIAKIDAGFPERDRYSLAGCESNPAARLIASRYEKLADSGAYADPPAWAAACFRLRVMDLFNAMPRDLVEICDHEPYVSLEDMAQDRAAGRFLVRRRLQGPFAGRRTMQWRAVHDYYGHLETKGEFTFSGEVLAYVRHTDQFPRCCWPFIYNNVIAENTFRLVNGHFYCKNFQCSSIIVHDIDKFGPEKEFYASCEKEMQWSRLHSVS
jgi:hypothetical protein